MSTYDYVLANPIRYVDTLGLFVGGTTVDAACMKDPLNCPKPLPPPTPKPTPIPPPPMLPSPEPHPEPEKKCPKCEEVAPNMNTCMELVQMGYMHHSMQSARASFSQFGPTTMSNVDKAWEDRGSCTHPQQHFGIYLHGVPKRDGRVGSIVSCKCCLDRPGVPADPDVILYKSIPKRYD